MIFLLKFLLKRASKSSFFCFGVGSGSSCKLLQFVRIVVRTSFVLCNSVCADRSGKAGVKVPRSCSCKRIILLCFASRSRESHCNGFMKVANGALAADFFILALMIFLLKFLLKRASKSSFFRFGVEIRFWSCKSLQFVRVVVCTSIVLCNSVSADRSGMAASTFLAAAAASVILLCFASENRESHCNGCMKVANGWCFGSIIFWALIIVLLNFLLKSASKSSFFRFGVEIHPVWSCTSVQFVKSLSVVFCI